MIRDGNFRRPSISNGTGGNNCVEVAWDDAGIHVRDSKKPDAGALTFTPDEWAAFTESTKLGEFDLTD